MNKATAGHTYKLKYDVQTEVGKFKAAAIKKDGKGGTDALIVISCIEHEDGAYSQTHVSTDGGNEGKSMSTATEFKAWHMFGAALLRRPDLTPKHATAIIQAVAAIFGREVALAMAEREGVFSRMKF